jgi:hypothetical protein
MDEVFIYNFEAPLRKGETFPGLIFKDISINATPVIITGCTVEMIFKKEKSGTPSEEWSTAKEIEITGASEITVKDDFVPELPEGHFYYAVKFKFTDGKILFLIKGEADVEAI